MDPVTAASAAAATAKAIGEAQSIQAILAIVIVGLLGMLWLAAKEIRGMREELRVIERERLADREKAQDRLVEQVKEQVKQGERSAFAIEKIEEWIGKMLEGRK